jgi:cytochrome c553
MDWSHDNNYWTVMKKFTFALLLLMGLMGSAFAEGDAVRGQTLNTTCIACHGADGNSPTDLYPKLAGQHRGYLYKQLTEFKQAMTTGGRNNAIMMGMVVTLTDQDMADLSAYFETQIMSPNTTKPEYADAGQQLYMGGDLERGIAACTACHGPRGNGTKLSGFPKISGQYASYIQSQLMLFRSGERNNDPSGMMRDIAKKLTDADIELLSGYLGGLH